jgi:NADPH-dependent curcumin reductase CurA
VIESRAQGLSVGDRVTGMMDWSDEPVVDARGLTKVPDDSSISESWYLGVLGMPGLTAYVGLTDIGAMSGSEQIFISGAAGAVGSIAGQIAKARGATVVGSAGSADKVAQLRALGFDDAFCYRDESPRRALARMVPSGINLYFDNVGGAHLEAALDALVDFGVVVSCGAISLYNATEAVEGPRNFESSVVKKRLRIQGFIVTDHMKAYPRFVEEVVPLIQSGKLQVLETVREGFASLPEAFLGLFHGANLGKMVVRV